MKESAHTKFVKELRAPVQRYERKLKEQERRKERADKKREKSLEEQLKDLCDLIDDD